MKRVIVACGSGIAVSQVVAMKVRKQLRENGIEADLIPISIYDIKDYINTSDAYIKLIKGDESYPIPTVDGTLFLSGDKEKEEGELQKLIAILQQ